MHLSIPVGPAAAAPRSSGSRPFLARLLGKGNTSADGVYRNELAEFTAVLHELLNEASAHEQHMGGLALYAQSERMQQLLQTATLKVANGQQLAHRTLIRA